MIENSLQLDDSAWRARLTPEQYHICRQCGTEPRFSGRYHDTKTAGTYLCACCGAPVFHSSGKYDSRTGWPSFFKPINDDALRLLPDHSHGMIRTEVRCARCDGHLGHLFDDGPAPTGLRYCINSASLELREEA